MREGIAEIAEITERRRYDLKLVLATVALVVLGLIMIASASQMVKLQRVSGPHFYFFYRQLMLAALGIFMMGLFMRVPYHLYEKFAGKLFIAALVLLGAVLVIGTEIRGSSRAIYIANFDFQPVEAAKILLVVFLAAKISEWGDRIRDFKTGFLPLASSGMAMAGMVALQPNISNAVLIAALTFVILFVAGCRVKHILIFGFATLAAAAPFLLHVSKVVTRLKDYIHGGGSATNFQLEQSLIALGSGALFGTGPGRGHQKYRFLPDAHTDFIYSIIGEELGLIGTIVVLLIFVFILRRAVRTAKRAPDSFGYLLALGIGFLIFMSAAVNIMMTTGIIPTAGLPLPFISYGGSSLIASLAAIGIIVNISFEGRERKHTGGMLGLQRTAKAIYAKRA
ncbi:MAG: putative peptidoglycan glycosyltransferase FtsW [Candidatus Krumholzibacteria bacterium]|nr:putative peptidoglycan glycosyltransferase FtsW [Candidatus Krumholzibacteria bacterium]